jgi:hypothetical protein
MTTREQFLQRLRRYCRKNGIAFEILPGQGKGSHYTLLVGSKLSIIQSGDISPQQARTILKQLNLPRGAV